MPAALRPKDIEETFSRQNYRSADGAVDRGLKLAGAQSTSAGYPRTSSLTSSATPNRVASSKLRSTSDLSPADNLAAWMHGLEEGQVSPCPSQDDMSDGLDALVQKVSLLLADDSTEEATSNFQTATGARGRNLQMLLRSELTANA